MKYILETNTSGGASITRAPEFLPPTGLLLPGHQDTQYSVASATELGSLITSSNPTLPDGLELHASQGLFVRDGGVWLNQADESDSTSVEVSGSIILRNNADYDIGITW